MISVKFTSFQTPHKEASSEILFSNSNFIMCVTTFGVPRFRDVAEHLHFLLGRSLLWPL